MLGDTLTTPVAADSSRRARTCGVRAVRARYGFTHFPSSSMRGALQCSGFVAPHFAGRSSAAGIKPHSPAISQPLDLEQCSSLVGRHSPQPLRSKYAHWPMPRQMNEPAQSASLAGWQSVERHSSLSPIGRYAHPPCSLHVSDARHAAWYCAKRSGAIGKAIGAGALGCWQATNNSTGNERSKADLLGEARIIAHPRAAVIVGGA